MATLAELTDDTLGHQFSATQYTLYAQGKLNQAQRHMCAQTDFRELQAQADTALVDAQSEYPLPADFQRLKTVWVYEDAAGQHTQLERLTDTEFDLLPPETGCPSGFNIRGDELRLWPTPGPGTVESVRLKYYALPPTLDTADTPVIPEQYQYLMVHYALKFCFERENDYAAAQYHWNMYQEGILKCRTEVQHDTSDYSQPRVIGDGQR
jgi:hypothetical protein